VEHGEHLHPLGRPDTVHDTITPVDEFAEVGTAQLGNDPSGVGKAPQLTHGEDELSRNEGRVRLTVSSDEIANGLDVSDRPLSPFDASHRAKRLATSS